MFALTPQTEEKYKKIDEEFDKMMQSYRLAVSSWWSAAPPLPLPSDGGAASCMALLRSRAVPWEPMRAAHQSPECTLWVRGTRGLGGPSCFPPGGAGTSFGKAIPVSSSIPEPLGLQLGSEGGCSPHLCCKYWIKASFSTLFSPKTRFFLPGLRLQVHAVPAPHIPVRLWAIPH